MTAPAHPDRQGTREALTEALRVGEPWPGAPRPEVIAERIADVVERLCDQRSAEALAAIEELADWLDMDDGADLEVGPDFFYGRSDAADRIRAALATKETNDAR